MFIPVFPLSVRSAFLRYLPRPSRRRNERRRSVPGRGIWMIDQTLVPLIVSMLLLPGIRAELALSWDGVEVPKTTREAR